MKIVDAKCPVCNRMINEINKSNAKFNDDYICIYCINVINKKRGGKISAININLEELQAIVKQDKKNKIIAVIILLVIIIFGVFFIKKIVQNEPEEVTCQTKEECDYEEYWETVRNSKN